MNPYDIVAALEERVAEYSGAPYAVAVDSCTNALLIALRYYRMKNGGDTIILPKRTYVGVAYAAMNAGYKIKFEENQWSGAYSIGNTNIIDSARRFKKNMYVPGSFYCVSGHWSKILKMGRGGFILTDSESSAKDMRRMRFDGREAGVRPTEDNFILPGYHCYMLPSEAAHAMMLMMSMKDDNEDIPWDDYADLSKYDIFRGS